jgi:hypothetical protein
MCGSELFSCATLLHTFLGVHLRKGFDNNASATASRLGSPYDPSIRPMGLCPVLIKDLPEKAIQRLLRSVTWTDVDAVFPPHIVFLKALNRRAHQGRGWVRGWRQATARQFKAIRARSGRGDTHGAAPNAYAGFTAPRHKERVMAAHSWNESDPRWGKRITVNIPVHLMMQDAAASEGCLKNVSLSGALMSTAASLRLHSELVVGITRKTGASQSFLVKAQVARKQNEDVAVQWSEFSPEAIKELLRDTAGTYVF